MCSECEFCQSYDTREELYVIDSCETLMTSSSIEQVYNLWKHINEGLENLEPYVDEDSFCSRTMFNNLHDLKIHALQTFFKNFVESHEYTTADNIVDQKSMFMEYITKSLENYKKYCLDEAFYKILDKLSNSLQYFILTTVENSGNLLYYLIEIGHEKAVYIVDLFINNGLSFDKEYAIQMAAKSGQVKIAKNLIELHGKVSAEAVITAYDNQHYDLCWYLLDKTDTHLNLILKSAQTVPELRKFLIGELISRIEERDGMIDSSLQIRNLGKKLRNL